MRLLIIRHGDPDYEKDSLTEKGWREAALLADSLLYVSPPLPPQAPKLNRSSKARLKTKAFFRVRFIS